MLLWAAVVDGGDVTGTVEVAMVGETEAEPEPLAALDAGEEDARPDPEPHPASARARAIAASSGAVPERGPARRTQVSPLKFGSPRLWIQ